MPLSHPWRPSSPAKPLIIAGCSLPPRREILIIVSSSDYNFLSCEALLSLHEFALLDFLILPTGTLETQDFCGDRRGRTLEDRRSHD